MWIKELVGENFSGMNFHDIYGSKEVKISGRNKSGKSTRIKAFFWLMSGYTSANEPLNANLFDNRIPLTKDTPEARVCAKVVLDDGQEVELERVARCKFQRRRGTDVYEKASSDEYVYRIDNIERSATDFREWISAFICPEDMLRFCLDGSFFLNLCFDDKKKARQIIENVIGSVSREEMTGDYSAIDELLKTYCPDDIETRAANLSKGVSKRLDEIPSLITSKTSELSEIEQTDFAAVDEEISRLEGKRGDYSNQLLDLTERMKPVLKAKSKAEKDKEMKIEVYKKAEQEYKNGWVETDNKLVAEISQAQAKNDESAIRKRQLLAMNETDGKYITTCEESLDTLRAEKKKYEDQSFEDTGICPVCGSKLPENIIEQKKAEFQKAQRDNIATTVKRAREIQDTIALTKKKIEDRIQEINNIAIIDTTPLEQKLHELRIKDIPLFSQTEQGIALQADIDSTIIPEASMPEDKDIKEKIDNINTELVSLYEKRGLKARGNKLRNDIEDLRTEQREKGAELAEYERQRQSIKNYKQEQMEILSRKVNDSLSHSRIDCWSQQKSGDMVPDLVIKDANGVNFACTNMASRIITTCDIQKFFCEKLGVSMPIFIDEVSVMNQDNIPHYEGTQTFLLFCADTPLNVETI